MPQILTFTGYVLQTTKTNNIQQLTKCKDSEHKLTESFKANSGCIKPPVDLCQSVFMPK